MRDRRWCRGIGRARPEPSVGRGREANELHCRSRIEALGLAARLCHMLDEQRGSTQSTGGVVSSAGMGTSSPRTSLMSTKNGDLGPYSLVSRRSPTSTSALSAAARVLGPKRSGEAARLGWRVRWQRTRRQSRCPRRTVERDDRRRGPGDVVGETGKLETVAGHSSSRISLPSGRRYDNATSTGPASGNAAWTTSSWSSGATPPCATSHAWLSADSELIPSPADVGAADPQGPRSRCGTSPAS